MVSGPNVMSGYLKADRPGELQPPEGGWYDTGDIVSIDDDGFVTIQGRVKRFAKIGGEMISLAAVETWVARLWPDEAHAVTNLPDPKKGEQLVLVTAHQGARREDLTAFARTQGIAELAVPRAICVVPEVPVLGTGKLDYVKVRALAEDSAAAAGQGAKGDLGDDEDSDGVSIGAAGGERPAWPRRRELPGSEQTPTSARRTPDR